MKFDYIVINPPYKGSLHLEFFKKGLKQLKDTGKMMIIEPATWLINVRKNDITKHKSCEIEKYDEIKRKLDGHFEFVTIENLNNDFKIINWVPFSITMIDMSKKFNFIKFYCCGDYREVKSIYDCNLIGNYDIIWSILNKVLNFGNMMKNHITNKELDGDYWYAVYQRVLKCNVTAYNTGYYQSDNSYNGEICKLYYLPTFDYRYNISNKIHKAKDKGGKLRDDKNALCVYGKKEEIENWKYFILNNKLPLFINYVMSIGTDNCSKPFIPWLVDKKYTDEEINELFNFSDEEIKFIDSTLEKFKRHHTWFKRYMLGPNLDTKNDLEKTDIRKERHEITQEDFTPPHIVDDMLSRLSDDLFINPDKTVLDNSCGIGNFLVEILRRKLSYCKSLDNAKRSIMSIYGVELMADNVEECRNRLYNTFIKFFPEIKEDEIYHFQLRQIIRNRIQWCDTLKFNYDKWPSLNLMKQNYKNENIEFGENKPNWNDDYPMWKPLPEIIEQSLF